MARDTAVFDVDRTLIDTDLQPMFLTYARKKGLIGWFDYARTIGAVVLYKLGILSGSRAMMFAYRFIVGHRPEDIAPIAGDFFRDVVQAHFFSDIVAIAHDARAAGSNVVILSMVPEVLLRPIAEHIGASDVIGTRLEVRDGAYTGRILGEIVGGAEKARALSAYRSAHTGGTLYAYADNISDLELLETADVPVAVNPHPRLRTIARERSWKMIEPTPNKMS